jgi:hypothetical protein
MRVCLARLFLSRFAQTYVKHCPLGHISRVRETGGNRSGSTGSRWNRSGLVHEPVRFPPKNRAYKFAIPVNRPVSPVNRPVFADSRKPLPGGFVNPAHKCSQLTLSSTTKISSLEVVARGRGGSVDESTTAGRTPCRALEHEWAAGSGGAPY